MAEHPEQTGHSETPQAPRVVSEFPSRVILDLRTTCNLRCPMCPVWGVGDEDAQETVSGIMPLEKARAILDEVMESKPLVHPQFYGEPLLARDFKKHIAAMKSRGLSVALNTNGLTLNEKTAAFLVEQQVDAVFISIDAVTQETLMKVRGVDKLEKIEAAVFRLLEARGDGALPRVGVSITVQEENRHEESAFVEKWSKIVDCVRVGAIFMDGRLQGITVPEQRVPCPAIYMTMPVRNDGSTALCCMDGLGDTDMGNVFERGVKDVWHGPEFNEVRRLHEVGEYDKVPMCKDCNRWASYIYEEEIKDGFLIRRSPEYVYYNRLDRLENWEGQSRTGHDTELADG